MEPAGECGRYSDMTSKRIRICHISTVHPADDVRVFHRECGSLARAGYEVHLVIRTPRAETIDGVHLHPLPNVRLRLLRMTVLPWIALRRALKTRADIYHYHDPELIPVGFVLRWLFRRKVVYDVHEFIPGQIMGKQWLPRWSRRVVALAYRMVEKLLTPGQQFVLANENCVPSYPPSACLVRNYPLLRDPPKAANDDERFSRRPPLLVYVGGVSEDRGALLYVDLVQGLAARGIDVRLMIIGPASASFGRRLTAHIADTDTASRVTLTGRLESAAAMAHAAEAAIGLCLLKPSPNYTTCLATKIFEYMMVGTPVLASDFAHWQPYVLGEQAGRMADPGRLDEVVDVCAAMLADPAALRAMGARGAAAVRERYNWDSEFQALWGCYRRLLIGSTDRAPDT